MNFKEYFKKYAQVAINIGVNLQQGQQLIINAPIEAKDLVRYVVDEAYQQGASLVTVFYVDDYVELSRYKNCNKNYLEETAGWLSNGQAEAFGEVGAARLVILGRNPTLLKDIDPELIATASRARAKSNKKLMNLVTSSASQWSIISYATPEWAKQVFPHLSVDDAVEQLWKEIFTCCRLDDENPVENWAKHNQTLAHRSYIMNEACFDGLKYESEKADLYVGLANGHVWEGGAGESQKNIMFNANIPTEEVFTTPHRNNVQGWIESTKPLLYRGTLIDGIRVEFVDGKAVNVTATHGQKVLLDMINEDEGASHLGEVALVPHNSPISNSGVIFKETLFDENASCHLAFGQSYTKCMTEIDGESKEDYMIRGGNFSTVHTDWMVGDETTKIYGIKGDKKILIISDGEWVFEGLA